MKLIEGTWPKNSYRLKKVKVRIFWPTKGLTGGILLFCLCICHLMIEQKWMDTVHICPCIDRFIDDLCNNFWHNRIECHILRVVLSVKVRSHWVTATATASLQVFTLGGVNGNGNGKMQCNQMGCCCRCHQKWVPNPFHDNAIAIAIAIAIGHHVNSLICLHRTHSWRKKY